jgi:hypothetical protein
MWPTRIIGGIDGVAPFIVLVGALMVGSWWPMAAYIAVSVSVHLALVLGLKLLPISEEQVTKSKRSRWLIGGSIAAAITASVIVALTK